MTRTAADVQAEIEALEQASHERSKATLEQVQARPKLEPPAVDQEAIDAINETLRLGLTELDAINALKAERDRLARKELDAEVDRTRRHEALRLRAVFRGEEPNPRLWMQDVLDTEWAALPIDEARGWARVEAEMGP